MNDPILQLFSPFIVLLIAYLFSTGLPRVFYLALPLSTLCLYLYYPGTALLQIAAVIIWILHIIATWQIKGVSIKRDNRIFSKTNVILLILAVICSTILVFFCFSHVKGVLNFILLILIFSFIFFRLVLRPILYFVIAPILCKEKVMVIAELKDYNKTARISNNKTNGVVFWHSYIYFKNDPDYYEIEYYNLKKYRGQINVRFSYLKCECPFGFTFITKIRQMEQSKGIYSQWDLSPYTQRQRKMNKIIIISFTIIMIFFAIFVYFIYSL